MTITESAPMNGVDLDSLFGTINVVKGQPELAQFGSGVEHLRAAPPHHHGGVLRGRGTTTTRRSTPTTPTTVLTGNDEARPRQFLPRIACLTAGIATTSPPPRREPVGRPREATSTCRASSVCPTRSATATRASGTDIDSPATTPTSRRSSSSRSLGGPHVSQRHRVAVEIAS
jgi:hypothetical protein